MSRGPSLDADEYFRRHAGLVYRRALVLLRNPSDAEDAVQEVFVRALANRSGFRGESMTSTWLYRITTNYCLNELRNSGRRLQLLREHHGERSSLPLSPSQEDTLVLRTLLADAPEDQAAAAVYVFVDGMTRPEAAEVLGVSLRTVGNLLARFKSRAREVLRAEGGAPVPDFLEPRIGRDERPSVPEPRGSSVKSTGSPA